MRAPRHTAGALRLLQPWPSLPRHERPAPRAPCAHARASGLGNTSLRLWGLILGSSDQATAEDFPALPYLSGCPSTLPSLTKESQATSTTLDRDWSPWAAGRDLAPAPAAMRSSASPVRPSGPPSRIAPRPWPPVPEKSSSSKSRFRGTGHSVRLHPHRTVVAHCGLQLPGCPGQQPSVPSVLGRRELHLPQCPWRKWRLP